MHRSSPVSRGRRAFQAAAVVVTVLLVLRFTFHSASLYKHPGINSNAVSKEMEESVIIIIFLT